MRKIIQFQVFNSCGLVRTHALCNDGTVWVKADFPTSEWVEEIAIPQPEPEYEVIGTIESTGPHYKMK